MSGASAAHHELFALLISLPPATPATRAQREAIAVLADQHADRPLATWISERLQGRAPTEARAVELGLQPWRVRGELRGEALELLPLGELLPTSDARAALRALAWINAAPVGRPLHAPVAALLWELLRAVERRELAVTGYGEGRFRLATGWQLDVFVRGWNFWRIDGVIDPQGFMLHLLDFDEDPLRELNQYEPPPEIEAEVYGLGLEPGRRVWR